MVELQDGSGLVVENCFFNRPGGNGVLLSNYLRGTVIEGNEFVFPGDSAILSLGTTQLIDATLGTQPRGTEIAHNLAHEVGIWGKQQGGLYQGLTAQTHLHHNVFFNGPRAGINVRPPPPCSSSERCYRADVGALRSVEHVQFNDGMGGGHLVEHNLVFNFVRETSDHGTFNRYGRGGANVVRCRVQSCCAHHAELAVAAGTGSRT